MTTGRFQIKRLVLILSAMAGTASWAANQDAPAYKINNKVVSVGDVEKKDRSTFFDLEQKKYQRVSDIAKQEYLEQYFNELSKKRNTTVDKAKETYLKEHIKVSDSEVNEILTKLKDHPKLSKLSKEEQKNQVRDYISAREAQKVLETLVDQAQKDGKFQVLYPRPEEPVYDIKIGSEEPVRYGPTAADTKPVGCKGDECPITVIEYSEFQCPYCEKMLGDTKQVLQEYKGKIRWYVRDFPLEFHDRARPAAIAAKCASFQGKYWDMYHSLFANQRDLSDDALTKRAKDLKLNMSKFNECFKPKDAKSSTDAQTADALIRKNFESGRSVGVEGTPAFFINGKKLSGALPYSEFKRIIDQDLAKLQKSPKS